MNVTIFSIKSLTKLSIKGKKPIELLDLFADVAHKRRACNARDKRDLLASFLQVKSYGYRTGFLSEAQVQSTFLHEDLARKPW